MPVQDQAVWPTVNITVAGRRRTYGRGELLPDPADEREAHSRQLLRLGGALRVVEVVFTEADRTRRGGAASAAQAAEAAGVTTAVADHGGMPSGAPVVLGPPPPRMATQKDWAAYAVTQGMPEEEAAAMTRDALWERFRAEPPAE